MERLVALFLCVMTIGCLRPVWGDNALITLQPVVTSRNGTPPVIETAAEDPDDTDLYRITFDETALRPERIRLIGAETTFTLGCVWQGPNCLSLVSEEARGSPYLRIHVTLRMCPRIRIFREDMELTLLERFRWSCVFVLGEPEESSP